MYFISAAVILLASLPLIVQVSLPYSKTGRTSVSSVVKPTNIYADEIFGFNID